MTERVSPHPCWEVPEGLTLKNMYMKRILTVLPFFFIVLLPSSAQTLEECQQAAERNYPLIRQYDLIANTTDLTVSNISKEWLPQVTASAQATLQSDVASWPEQMQTMLKGMGVEYKGLKRDQYRVGIDMQQTIYDGEAIKYRKEIARRQGEAETAQTEVTLYQVRQRVNDMYFALLLLGEQARLNRDLLTLLCSNENKLQAMFLRGTAAESDYLNVKAERLKASQQLNDLESRQTTLKRMLSVFCGIEVTSPSLPPMTDGGDGYHPELKAIDAQLRLADAKEKALDAALRPKLGVFAQGYYGYPGLNMFEDMMHRQWSLNGLIGARLSWNIGALYTRKNDKAKLSVQRSMFNVQRDAFLFNNQLQQLQQNDNISRYQKLLADDAEIISLRSAVRKAAESKLSHGIIDVNDLLREINNENVARIQQSVHEIEMMKEIYELKYARGER